MTLSLDDVRNKRFRLARKSGYEVAEVDDFLDQLQESFAQLIQENENLKRQIDAFGSAEPGAAADAGPLPAAAPAAPAAPETVVVTTSPEASSAVVRLVQMSTEHAEQLVAEATAEAERIRSQADESASKLSTDARSEAERLQAEARGRAENLRTEAQARADQLDSETAARRQQLLADLEHERISLAGAIADLRRFEESFRTNLTAQLRRHIDVLESGRAEPADVPELADAPAPTAADTVSGSDDEGPPDVEESEQEPDDGVETDPDATIQVSDTPRLDALLRDQR